MSTSESFEALRRANPRSRAAFAESVDAVRAQFAIADAVPRQPRGADAQVSSAWRRSARRSRSQSPWPR
jgi:hypothetical protein